MEGVCKISLCSLLSFRFSVAALGTKHEKKTNSAQGWKAWRRSRILGAENLQSDAGRYSWTWLARSNSQARTGTENYFSLFSWLRAGRQLYQVEAQTTHTLILLIARNLRPPNARCSNTPYPLPTAPGETPPQKWWWTRSRLSQLCWAYISPFWLIRLFWQRDGF